MELFVGIPPHVIRQARKHNDKTVKTQGANLDFRLSLIVCCLEMDPRHGHFELKNNYTNNNGVSLQLYHVGSCKKRAIIKEAPTQAGMMIKIEGDCTCKPKPSIEKVIELKVKFVKRWQIRQICSDEFVETLRSVGRNIELNLQPVMSHDERACLIENLAEEGLQALELEFANLVPKPKLLGGGDDSASGQGSSKSETIDDSTTSVEIHVEGPLFELVGIKQFFLKFLHKRTITTRTSSSVPTGQVGDTSQPTN